MRIIPRYYLPNSHANARPDSGNSLDAPVCALEIKLNSRVLFLTSEPAEIARMLMLLDHVARFYQRHDHVNLPFSIHLDVALIGCSTRGGCY
jgi:hypothetical protein